MLQINGGTEVMVAHGSKVGLEAAEGTLVSDGAFHLIAPMSVSETGHFEGEFPALALAAGSLRTSEGLIRFESGQGVMLKIGLVGTSGGGGSGDGMSTTTKIALGVGAVVLVGGLIWAFRK